MGARRSWYTFTAKAGGEDAEVFLYDVIGYWGVTAKSLIDEVKAAGKLERITLRINSPGGEVFDSLAIYNYLKGHAAAIDVVIDGLAASGASVVAMAGDTISMPENALMMVHNPAGLTWGTASDFREYADRLDKMRDNLLTIYADRTGLENERLIELLDDETWMNAAEARDLGFVDEVTESVDMAASAGFNLARYRNAPQIAAVTDRRAPQPKDEAMNEEQLKRMRAALGLGETATTEDIITATVATQEDAGATIQIAAALGCDEGASVETLVEAAAKLRKAANDESAALREVRELRAEAAVARATKAGKITASNRAWATALAAKDPEGFAAWEQSAPKVVPIDVKTPATAADNLGDSEPSDEQIAALAKRPDVVAEAKAQGVKAETYAKVNYEELIAEVA